MPNSEIFSFATTGPISAKIQTKGFLDGCLSASIINDANKAGPLQIIFSKSSIKPDSAYYCIKGKVVKMPSNLPCSMYATTALEVNSATEIQSSSQACQ